MTSTASAMPPESASKSLWKDPRLHLAVAAFNGALYFFIAREGGQNLQSFLHMHGHNAKIAIAAISAGAALVYTMFTFKTLESINLRAKTFGQWALTALAPFSASAFFTGGYLGCQLVDLSQGSSLAVGGMLFTLRLLNCIDASVKFPDRLREVASDWKKAWTNKDGAELTRSVVTVVTTLLYSACATDAVYHASSMILGWTHASKALIVPVSFAASGLGAVGTLPLILYWVQRGLRQITWASKNNPALAETDPTDKFTYIGLALVIPVILGILGSATAANGQVFGQLGTFSQVSRIGSSVVYACCAGTPGMATLLRTFFGNASTDKSKVGLLDKAGEATPERRNSRSSMTMYDSLSDGETTPPAQQHVEV